MEASYPAGGLLALPGWKKHCLYETELPGKHEAYVLKWATSTRQITKLWKQIEKNHPKYRRTFLIARRST